MDYQDLMTRFRRAYAKADVEKLADVLSADFEWHTHTFDPADPVTTGRVLVGVNGMLAELERRRQDWSDVRYEGLQERFAPKLVTQTFTISGLDQGVPFAVAAVDLYDVDDSAGPGAERLSKKDTYWKYGETK